LVEYHGIKSRGKRGPRKLVSIQGSPPPNSGEMHPDQEEVKQKHQEAYMDEQGAPGQTQAEKGGLQRIETRICSLRGIQRNHPSSQGAS